MPTEDKKNTTIAVVTYPGVALLDLVATKTVLDSLAMGTRYRSVTVGERTEPIASNTPMRIIPEKRFEEVPEDGSRRTQPEDHRFRAVPGINGLRPGRSAPDLHRC